ncbi:predicted protein [Nematostella vectensis]|uniref:Uncharacterized protein n=1 Tax=Nematostella vectensis TaxID=45351 RepID=A7T8J0_NEMVE|nr:predicted protein [Nematostella vectensis]|eukprot:XP_001619795.1 hypothetical protein NEMVEDRAFT_v1g223817 [Nematostella vectensis]
MEDGCTQGHFSFLLNDEQRMLDEQDETSVGIALRGLELMYKKRTGRNLPMTHPVIFDELKRMRLKSSSAKQPLALIAPPTDALRRLRRRQANAKQGLGIHTDAFPTGLESCNTACQTDAFPTGLESCNTACQTDPFPTGLESCNTACQTDPFPTGLQSCNTACQTDPFPTGLESCNTACQTDPFPTGLESCNTACQTDPFPTGLESCNTACQTDPFPTGLESCNTACQDQIEFNLVPKAFILNLISELGSPRPDSVKRMHHFRPPVLRDVAMRISYKLFEIERFCRLIENAGYKFKKDVSWRGNAVVEEDESLESLQKLELARNRAGKTKSARPTCRSSIVVHTPEGRISREIEIIWWTDLYEDTDIAKLFLLTKYFSIKLFVFQLTILFLYSF